MDIYRNTLLLLKDLLHKSGDTHWERWIDGDIVEWDHSKSTSQHNTQRTCTRKESFFIKTIRKNTYFLMHNYAINLVNNIPS